MKSRMSKSERQAKAVIDSVKHDLSTTAKVLVRNGRKSEVLEVDRVYQGRVRVKSGDTYAVRVANDKQQARGVLYVAVR